ncbi:hypothetical protein Hanom_Chr04g00341701 [Helianthus anomalus]
MLFKVHKLVKSYRSASKVSSHRLRSAIVRANKIRQNIGRFRQTNRLCRHNSSRNSLHLNPNITFTQIQTRVKLFITLKRLKCNPIC